MRRHRLGHALSYRPAGGGTRPRCAEKLKVYRSRQQTQPALYEPWDTSGSRGGGRPPSSSGTRGGASTSPPERNPHHGLCPPCGAEGPLGPRNLRHKKPLGRETSAAGRRQGWRMSLVSDRSLLTRTRANFLSDVRASPSPLAPHVGPRRRTIQRKHPRATDTEGYGPTDSSQTLGKKQFRCKARGFV